MSPNTNFPQNLDIAPSAHSLFKLADGFTEEAQRSAINRYGIAGRVWETAYAMSFYVNPLPEHEFEPRFFNSPSPHTMIELGCGTGVVAAAIAKILDCHNDMVIATDLPEICPLLSGNLLTSRRCPVLVKPLPWGDADAGLQLAYELFSGPSKRALAHIICSDLVYFPELFAPLLRTILQLTSPLFIGKSSQPAVIISYQVRSLTKESAFWSAFGLWFHFEPVLVKTKLSPGLYEQESSDNWQWLGVGEEDRNFIFAAHRRVDSLTWEVPLNDQDLLDGVNAWGNAERKSGDRFESYVSPRRSINCFLCTADVDQPSCNLTESCSLEILKKAAKTLTNAPIPVKTYLIIFVVYSILFLPYFQGTKWFRQKGVHRSVFIVFTAFCFIIPFFKCARHLTSFIGNGQNV